MLTFPDAWMDAQVTLYRQPELGEVIFFLYNGSDIYDRSQELCRVRVYSTRDYQDKLAAETYFPLGQKGTFEYFGSLPATTVEGMKITSKQMKEMFSFIN